MLMGLLAGSLFSAFGQDVLRTGRVQAQTGRAAIPFVNIGIKGKNTGTTANENGEFALHIPSSLAHDTLTFSAVGFQEQALAIAKLVSSQQHTFILAEKTTALKEVVVLGRTPKTRRIGTTTHNPVIWGQVKDRETHDVREFAKLIPLGKLPAELVQAHIFLRYPTVDTVTFRLNFYRVAEGLPGERLIEQAILVHTPIQNGWLTIDLTKYDLRLHTDFFVGFEFLPEKKQAIPVIETKFAAPIFSYGGQFGGAAISRSSLGTWKRELGASLSAYLMVRQ